MNRLMMKAFVIAAIIAGGFIVGVSIVEALIR